MSDVEYAVQAAGVLPPLFHSVADDVAKRLRKVNTELAGIGPDPRLPDLLRRSAAELEAVRRRIEEVAAEANERDIDAALGGDAGAANAAAALRAQLESLRSQAAALSERVAGIERRIEADRVESWQRKAGFAAKCAAELSDLRAERCEAVAEGLRAALCLIGAAAATDAALANAISALAVREHEYRRKATVPASAPTPVTEPPPGVRVAAV
ncbi:MAG TPA: hypothetical protein PLC79_03715 [Phycisphaerae bacterium]|nr:hypothetical protein [Phycisphaerae bacterium]